MLMIYGVMESLNSSKGSSSKITDILTQGAEAASKVATGVADIIGAVKGKPSIPVILPSTSPTYLPSSFPTGAAIAIGAAVLAFSMVFFMGRRR